MCCYGKKQFGRMVCCCTIGLVCGWVTRSDGIWEQKKKKTYELSERKVSKQDILNCLPHTVLKHMSRNHTKLCFLRKIFSLKSKTSPTSQRPHLVYVSMHILVVLAAKPKFMDEDGGVYREKNV